MSLTAIVHQARRTSHSGALHVASMLTCRPGIRRVCRLGAPGPRILCYHGVCDDRVADHPWVPDYFVSASRFAEQMDMLVRTGRVVSLSDAVVAGTLPVHSERPYYAITFDDVAACTYRHALPVLSRYGIGATFFASTGHAENGALFAADVVHLLRTCDHLRRLYCDRRLRCLLLRPHAFKALATDTLENLIGPVEARIRAGLDSRMRETLRPMNWDELGRLDRLGHEIGGHTVDHAILGSQDRTVRRRQIAGCIAAIRERIGKQPQAFAYPNGGRADFDECDKQVLRDYGVRIAVSTRPGSCTPATDRLDVPRVVIGMHHRAAHFRAEMVGVLDRRHRRQQGWG